MSVYLWVDPLSEDETSLQSILCHTSIYVEFGEDLKYVFSYNDDGLSCFPAAGESPPKEQIFLGKTFYTLPQATNYAKHLERTKFRQYVLVGKNCNDFSHALSLGLCKKPIPDKYLNQDVGAVGAGIIFGGIAGVLAAAAIGAFKIFAR